MKYYIAGGAVRDLLLNRPLRDVDITFDGAEEEFIQANPLARKVADTPRPIYILDGLEYSPVHALGPAADMAQRDFTINALALAENGILQAHPDPFQDLINKTIKPASDTALADDPIRAFRAARLHASLPGFSLHAACRAQMRELGASDLSSIAAEQVGRETLKACVSTRPGDFLRALAENGCLNPWFTELAGADSIPAGPPAYHNDNSVLEHIAEIMDKTAKNFSVDDRAALEQESSPWKNGEEKSGVPNDAIIGQKPYLETAPNAEVRSLAVWMALCHDLGKVSTDPAMLPKHIGHEERGEPAALALGERLRLPVLYRKAGAIAARLHMKAGRYNISRPGSKVDLLMALHSAHLFEPFFLMASQDSHNPLLPRTARADLETILAVTLPPEWQNKGAVSGVRLRELRCGALAQVQKTS